MVIDKIKFPLGLTNWTIGNYHDKNQINNVRYESNKKILSIFQKYIFVNTWKPLKKINES